MASFYTKTSACIASTYMGRLFDSRDDRNHEDKASQIWDDYSTEIRSLEPQERGQLSNYLDVRIKELENTVKALRLGITSKKIAIKEIENRIKDNKYIDALSPLVDKLALKEAIGELNGIKASENFQEMDNYLFMVKSYKKMNKIIYKYQDYLFDKKMNEKETD